MMKFKKLVVGTAMAGAFGFAAIGFGAGQAQADDFKWWDPVPSPGQISQLPFVPPPGQIAKLPFVPPPGQWDKPAHWFK